MLLSSCPLKQGVVLYKVFPKRCDPVSVVQDDTEKSKASVFLRLSAPDTVQARLSSPPSAGPTPSSRPLKRVSAPHPSGGPRDARELLVQSMEAKARVARKQAELARPGAASHSPRAGMAARQGVSELQPASIAARRTVAVSRVVSRSPGPAHAHAPKFASPASSGPVAR